MDLEPLVRLVDALRPINASRTVGENVRFNELLALLEADGSLRPGLSAYVQRVVNGVDVHRTLTDAGLPLGGFWTEMRQRIGYKVLPPRADPHTSDHLLVELFFREGDATWVSALPEVQCIRLLELLGLDGGGLGSVHLPDELNFAARVLSLRIAGMAFAPEVLRMVPEQEHLRNPFLMLAGELDEQLLALRDPHGVAADHARPMRCCNNAGR